MKRILLLITIGLAVFVTINRQRIYMWDPIANVSRDGVKQDNVRVMINYSNDVLMDDKSTDMRRIYLVQNWNNLAQLVTGPLKCVQYLACMTEADQIIGSKVTSGSRVRGVLARVTMTNKRVEFVDEDGALVTVSLRP